MKLWLSSEGSCCKLEITRGGQRCNLTLLDRSLAVDPTPSSFSLLTAGLEGESVPIGWMLKTVGRFGMYTITPPSIEDTREKSESGVTVSSRKLAEKVVPGCNVSRRRSFDGRIGQWTERVVEFLQFIVIVGGNSDKIVK